MPDGKPSFADHFDAEFPVGAEEGNRAYFGLNVLRGLVDGIDDFVHERQPRWQRGYREMGPVLLGSAGMWINDEELIDKLAELSGACVVFRKQEREPWKRKQLEQLRAVNERTPGIPIRAFPWLGDLAPKVDGQPAVIGPYDRMGESEIATFRTFGYRGGRGRFVPILHAKLALLGRLWWHDEGPVGPEDVIGFRARRLWISSANFTSASRSSLEFGYWTEDPALVEGAEDFLVKLIADSEDVDPEADAPDPTLAPVDFDDDAMAEAAAADDDD